MKSLTLADFVVTFAPTYVVQQGSAVLLPGAYKLSYGGMQIGSGNNLKDMQTIVDQYNKDAPD